MKTLANCKPSEFLAQTLKIKRHVASWLELTKILEIRKNPPKLEEGMSKEEQQEAIKRQAKANLNDMLEAVLEKYPEETIKILACVCFVDPDKADEQPMSFYLGAISEILNDENVISFFISLVQLAQTNISPVAKA